MTHMHIDPAVLDQVVAIIRETVSEDWIMTYDIDANTTFNGDLELESIEIVTVIAQLQTHYGERIKLADWLGTRSFEQIIGLSVGDVAGFLSERLEEH